MLQLARRIGFSVDIRDFLEFERAFQCDGVMQAPPEKQGMVLVGKIFSQLGDLRFQRQHLLRRSGQVAQFVQELLLAIRTQMPA